MSEEFMPKFRSPIPNRFRGISNIASGDFLERSDVGLFFSLRKDYFALAFLAVWILPIIGTGLFVLLNDSLLSNQIPLFYSKMWGEDQIASKQLIFLPILGAFVFGLVNVLLIFLFKQKDKLFIYLLLSSAAILSILVAITVVNIVVLMT